MPKQNFISVTASIGMSEYGNLEPQISLVWVGPGPREGTANFRQLRAAAFKLAAEAELHSVGADWVVIPEPGHRAGGRYGIRLELVDGTEAEAKRGLAILRLVAEAFR
jgi:hypothetical protein